MKGDYTFPPPGPPSTTSGKHASNPNTYLHQHHLPPPLRVLLQQPLEGQELQGDAADALEAVDPQDDFAALELGLERRCFEGDLI